MKRGGGTCKEGLGLGSINGKRQRIGSRHEDISISNIKEPLMGGAAAGGAAVGGAAVGGAGGGGGEVVILKLAMQYPTGRQAEEEFKKNLMEDVARALEVDLSLFAVRSMEPGSIVVGLQINGDDAAALKGQLEAQVGDKSSMLYKGKVTKHAISVDNGEAGGGTPGGALPTKRGDLRGEFFSSSKTKQSEPVDAMEEEPVDSTEEGFRCMDAMEDAPGHCRSGTVEIDLDGAGGKGEGYDDEVFDSLGEDTPIGGEDDGGIGTPPRMGTPPPGESDGSGTYRAGGHHRKFSSMGGMDTPPGSVDLSKTAGELLCFAETSTAAGSGQLAMTTNVAGGSKGGSEGGSMAMTMGGSDLEQLAMTMGNLVHMDDDEGSGTPPPVRTNKKTRQQVGLDRDDNEPIRDSQLEEFDPVTGVPLNKAAEAFCVACWNVPVGGSDAAAGNRFRELSANGTGEHRRGQSVGTFHVSFEHIVKATDNFNEETHFIGKRTILALHFAFSHLTVLSAP
jgi:hypothetical protein